MSKLADLVPPIELCKLIPKGEFGDSALVWIEVEIPQENKKEWRVVNTTKPILACHNPKHFAPTLEEIMEKLPKDDSYNDLTMNHSLHEKFGGYHIFYRGSLERHCFDKCAVIAALKLWLKLKGVNYEKE